MKKDYVVKQMEAYGFRAEKSAAGGWWVEVDYDCAGDSRWELFYSLKSIEQFLGL